MTTSTPDVLVPDIGLVIARYGEDLSWLREINLPCRVYNKGPQLDPAALPPGTEVVALANVGREAQTYLAHILDSYGRLPAFTAFLQGDPFAHLAPPEEPKMTPQGLRRRLLDLAAKDTPFAGLAWFRLRCDGLGRPHDLADPAKEGRWKGWGQDIPVARTFAALFQAPAPQEFIARGSTGNMLVRRDRILARPEAFYRRALDLVLADPDDADNTGHAFERLWQAIFSGAAATAGDTAGAAPSRPRGI
jgi:hypothetical protein